MRLHRPVLLASVAAALALSAAGPAHAQVAPNAPMRNVRPTGKATGDEPKTPPPPALPGALTNYQPAERSGGDLEPNEALFDAINRGDIADARAAITRGADTGARNVLGMTPLELAVDLSRSDIIFLLLSERGTTNATRTAAAQAKAAQAEVDPAAKAIAAKTVVGKTAPAAAAKLAATTKPAPAALPRQYAGPADPGTPNPQAGFLGFGGTVR